MKLAIGVSTVPAGTMRMKALDALSTEPRRALSAGFTLVETVMALAVGAIMLGALYNAFAFGYRTIGVTREDLRATEIMLQRLERVRLCSFSQLTDTSINPPTTTEYADPTDQPSGGGGVPYTVTFSTSVPPAGISSTNLRSEGRPVGEESG